MLINSGTAGYATGNLLAVPPFQVQYRCLYREFWYDQEPDLIDFNQACAYMAQTGQARRTRARLIDGAGRIVASYP